MLDRFLTILALTGLAFITAGNEYLSTCEAIDAAISDASKVYYPGECECEQPSR